MDPIEITTLDHWNPLDHNSSHMENIRPLLQFSPNAYDDLFACNAVMLVDVTELEVFSLTLHKVTKLYTTNQRISNPVLIESNSQKPSKILLMTPFYHLWPILSYTNHKTFSIQLHT